MSRAEEFIREQTGTCSQLHYNSACTLRHWITPDDARKAVEIARDELMENICQFIQEHHHEYTSWNTEEYELEFNTEQFIQDIKQLIKDE